MGTGICVYTHARGKGIIDRRLTYKVNVLILILSIGGLNELGHVQRLDATVREYASVFWGACQYYCRQRGAPDTTITIIAAIIIIVNVCTALCHSVFPRLYTKMKMTIIVVIITTVLITNYPDSMSSYRSVSYCFKLA